MGHDDLLVAERLPMRGNMAVSIYEAGELVERVEHENLICSAGLAQVAATMVWAAAQDQNVAMGSPLTPQALYPIYGALGSGTTAALTTDTQLGTEFTPGGRQVVASAGYAGPLLLLTFFFPTSTTSWAISECGVFVSGPSIASATINTGLLLNHSVFAATTKTAAQTATFQASFTF